MLGVKTSYNVMPGTLERFKESCRRHRIVPTAAIQGFMEAFIAGDVAFFEGKCVSRATIQVVSTEGFASSNKKAGRPPRVDPIDVLAARSGFSAEYAQKMRDAGFTDSEIIESKRVEDIQLARAAKEEDEERKSRFLVK